MRERIATAAAALAVSLLLGACQDRPSQPAAAAPEAVVPATDTTAGALKRAPAAGRQVPFVTPTKIGRVLGEQSPSPPASR